ncbi:MAG: cysteine desulfurase family protein [Chloroflexota bacterium]
MPGRSVYLDHAATTPLDERVLEAMLPYFTREFGNPSSIHRWGQRAEAAVEEARRTLAELLGASPDEIVFTSCGSESDNLALRGVCRAEHVRRGARHLLTTPVEHHAVLRTARQLAELEGFELELLPVDEFGRVAPAVVEERLRADTALVSVIFANNEIGSVNPIADLAQVCRRHGIPFHTDAVQAASQLEIDVGWLGVDLLSIGAHKFYGPKGIGALYVRRGTPIVPVQTGGGQESDLRAGTLNVPLIVGMAEALRRTDELRPEMNLRFQRLRDRIVEDILVQIPEARLTGHPSERLPNHASFVFRGIDGNALLAALDLAGFACSSGSACKTGDPEPSEVLTALGLPRDWALGSLRVTVGRATSDEDIAAFLAALPPILTRLRQVQRQPA